MRLYPECSLVAGTVRGALGRVGEGAVLEPCPKEYDSLNKIHLIF